MKSLGVVLLSFFFLILFQNCSEVRLSDLVHDQDSLTIPSEPEPDVVKEPLPEGAPENTTYNQQTESTATCNGETAHYTFEMTEIVQMPSQRKILSLKLRRELTTASGTETTYIKPTSWTSANPIVLKSSNPPTYEIQSIQACELVYVQANFTDHCGTDTQLGYIYTQEGCPPPNPNINVSCEDILRVEGQQRLTSAYRKPTSSSNYKNGPVETMGDALFSSGLPQPISEFWYPRESFFIQIPLGHYLSFKMVVPKGVTQVNFGFGGSGFPVNISISKCEGDFYLGRDSKKCLLPADAGPEVYSTAVVDAKDPRGWACEIKSGETYYVNVLPQYLYNGDPTNETPVWFGTLSPP